MGYRRCLGTSLNVIVGWVGEWKVLIKHVGTDGMGNGDDLGDGSEGRDEVEEKRGINAEEG